VYNPILDRVDVFAIEDAFPWGHVDDDVVNSTPEVWKFGRAACFLGMFSSLAGFIYCCVALCCCGQRNQACEIIFAIAYLLCGILMVAAGFNWSGHFEKLLKLHEDMWEDIEWFDIWDLMEFYYNACDGMCGLDLSVGFLQIFLGSMWLGMSGLAFKDFDSPVTDSPAPVASAAPVPTVVLQMPQFRHDGIAKRGGMGFQCILIGSLG